jgi:hypothetical protein
MGDHVVRLLVKPEMVSQEQFAKLVLEYTTAKSPRNCLRSHNRNKNKTHTVKSLCAGCKSPKKHTKECIIIGEVVYRNAVAEQVEKAKNFLDELRETREAVAKDAREVQEKTDAAAARLAQSESAKSVQSFVFPDEPDLPPNISNIAPGARRSDDAKANDSYEMARVMQYFKTEIEPTLRDATNTDFLLPNIHMSSNESICGPSNDIPADKLRCVDSIISGRRLIVVCPQLQFPGYFNLQGMACVNPKCKGRGGFTNQGYLYNVRIAHGLGSQRFYVLSSAYLHDPKRGGCGRSFMATNPEWMKQTNAVVRSAFPFSTFQRTIATQDLIQWNSISALEGVPTAVTARIGGEVSESATLVRETAQAEAECRRRLTTPGTLGRGWSVPRRNEPVELIRSFHAGTHMGRSLSRHFLDALLVTHLSDLSGLFVGAVDREGCEVLRLDHTFKVPTMVLRNPFSAMVTGMNEFGKLVLGCLVRYKDHTSMVEPIQDLDARARQANRPLVADDKRKREGIDTVIVDNPNGDFNFLSRILPGGVEVIGDAYHYMSDITKSVVGRCSGIATFAYEVACSWWTADPSDVAAEAERDKAAGKKPSTFPRFGGNSRVRHFPVRGTTLLKNLSRAVKTAKQCLKLKFNETKLTAAMERLEGAVAAEFTKDPRSGSYIAVGSTEGGGATQYVTRRGTSTLECAHRHMRNIARSSTSIVKLDLLLKGFFSRWNQRKDAKHRGCNPDRAVMDLNLVNANKVAVDLLESSLSADARQRHIELNKGHASTFWVVVEPVKVGESSSIGAFRKGSEVGLGQSFADAVAAFTSMESVQSREAGMHVDDYEDEDFFVDEDDDTAKIPMTPVACLLLRRTRDHLQGVQLLRGSMSTEDAFTLYKPTHVITEDEVTLFEILVQSGVFSPRDYSNAVSAEGPGVFTKMAHKTAEVARRWKLEDMSHWWNVQTWTLHGNGTASVLAPAMWTSGGRAQIELPEEVQKEISTRVNMDNVWLKDRKMLTAALGKYGGRRLRELNLPSREGHRLSRREPAYHARAESEKRTLALPSPQRAPYRSGGAKRRMLSSFPSTVDHPLEAENCPMCDLPFQRGRRHAQGCPVLVHFPGGTRCPRQERLVDLPLETLPGESVGWAMIRHTLAYEEQAKIEAQKERASGHDQASDQHPLDSTTCGALLASFISPDPGLPARAAFVGGLSAVPSFNMPSTKSPPVVSLPHRRQALALRLQGCEKNIMFDNTTCCKRDVMRLLSPTVWLNDEVSVHVCLLRAFACLGASAVCVWN